MSKTLFARVQLLLEETQDKIRKAEIKWQNSERQIRSLSERLQTVEGQVALLRAEVMQFSELARRTHGNHSNTGN